MPKATPLVSGVARITPHVSDSWLRRMWFIHSLGESEAGVAISLCLGAWGHEPKVTVKAPRAGPWARGLLHESAAWEIGTLGRSEYLEGRLQEGQGAGCRPSHGM